MLTFLLWFFAILVPTYAQGVDTGLAVDACEDDCYESGLCTRKQDGTCVAAGDDCAESWGCSREGRCTVRDGACVVGPGDCAKAGVCETDGACTEREGVCVVGSAAHCAASSDCATWGQCGLVNGECAATAPEHCAASERCAADGECVLDGHRCTSSAESCLASTNCRERGDCTSRAGLCSVDSDADCRRSEVCRVQGRCTQENQMCVASNDADCRKSTDCAQEGACSFIASTYPEPEPPPEPVEGGNMGMLALIGGAGLSGALGGEGHGPMCGPKDDADCSQSVACRSDGHCRRHVVDSGGGLGFSGPTCDPDRGSLLGADIGAGIHNLLGDGGSMAGGGLGARGPGYGYGGGGDGLGSIGMIGVGGGSDEVEPRVDPVHVLGDRKPRPVRQGLRAVRASVKKCTEAEVAVAFDVSAKGKLSNIEVRSGADGKTAACVVKAVGKASLASGPAVSATWTVRAGAAKK